MHLELVARPPKGDAGGQERLGCGDVDTVLPRSADVPALGVGTPVPAIPRSRIKSRSNSAMAAGMCKSRRPTGVVVSIAWSVATMRTQCSRADGKTSSSTVTNNSADRCY